MTAEMWLVQEPDGRTHEYDPVGERASGSRVLADLSGGKAGVTPRFSRESVRVFDDLRRRGGSAMYSDLRSGYGTAMRGVLRDAVVELTRLGVLEMRTDRVYGHISGPENSPQRILRLREGWEDLMLVSTWSRLG